MSARLGLKEWVRARPRERRGDDKADDPGACPGVEPEEGPGATFSRSFSAFSRSTSNCGKNRGRVGRAGQAPSLGPAPSLALGPDTDLHVVHGLPKLVQLVCRVEGLQADVRQLHLLLPQLGAQL